MNLIRHQSSPFFPTEIPADSLTNYEFHNIIKFIMQTNQHKFIKSFNKGQITIPKEFRDFLDLGDSFWLKMEIKDQKIIAKPIKQNISSQEYSQNLLKIKGAWFEENDWESIRKTIKNRIKKHD